MYLKSLTSGFKSFASSTTLARARHHLHRAPTVRASPTSSTRAAWVMGEASGRSRCAAARWTTSSSPAPPGRPPLGRAEVLLTIDNSDGALPIGYAEVTISRTMFRAAARSMPSAAAVPAARRSGAALGLWHRTRMHVIVGQGQLDAILRRRPGTAGASSRRRPGSSAPASQEAARKLGATEGNPDRLNDLLVEIRRQLKAPGPPGLRSPAMPPPCRPTSRTAPGAADRRRPRHRPLGPRAGDGRRQSGPSSPARSRSGPRGRARARRRRPRAAQRPRRPAASPRRKRAASGGDRMSGTVAGRQAVRRTGTGVYPEVPVGPRGRRGPGRGGPAAGSRA